MSLRDAWEMLSPTAKGYLAGTVWNGVSASDRKAADAIKRLCADDATLAEELTDWIAGWQEGNDDY